MKKKVLHLLSSNRYSGAENVACQIIDVFNSDIEMAYCSPNGPIKEFLDERQIDFLPIDKLSIRGLKKVIRDYKPDIIHAHDLRASIIAVQFSKKISIISHIHCKFEEMSRLSIKSVLYRMYLNKFSHIFTVSESILNEYIFSKAISKKGSVLYNVVNEKKLKEKANINSYTDNIDCVFLGRFSYQKNPQRLIHIINKVIQRQPNSKFVLIGHGEMLEEVQELAKQLNVINNISFTGFLNNPYPLLKSSKVMIMSSRTEGTPMCVLEAMLLGIPIVSTGVDGIKELINNGTEGYIYDADRDLVDAICHLITDEKNRRIISENAYNKAQVLNNLELYKKRLLEVYNKHLKEKINS